MIIRVRAFAYFREILGNERYVELKEGSDLGDLLKVISEERRARDLLFDSSGNLRDHVVLMRNRRNVSSGSLALELKDGDEVAVFPPVAGG